MLNRLQANALFASRAVRAAGAVSAYAMASMALAPSSAMAQDAEQAARNDGLQEIVVTANRRAEAINDISTSIAAYGREELKTANINDVKDLQVLAPSLTVGEVFDIARIFIRGIGVNVQNPGASGGVAVYTDGAPIERQEAQLASLFDLERVEVLSGPQGTLYGRNAIGGAINYITVKPSDTFEGSVKLSYGNYNSNQLFAAIGGPINDWLKVRVAFNMLNRSGFGRNIVSNTPINDEHRQMGRLSVIIEPSSKFSIFLSGEYYRQDDAAGVLTLHGGSRIDPATGLQTTDAAIIDPTTGKFAVVPEGLGGFAADKRDTAAPLDPYTRKKRWSATAQFDWNLNDWLTITSINNIQSMISWTSSYQASSSFFEFRHTSPLTRRIGNEPQMSTELQFKFENPWVNGILGVTYFDEKQTENQTLGSDGYFSNIRTSATRDYLVGRGIDPVEVLSFCKRIGRMILEEPGLPNNPPQICGWGQQKIKAFGLFGHANVNLGALGESLSPFTLKLGARYSDQSIDVYNPFFSFGYNASFDANPVAANITSFSWFKPEDRHKSAKFDDFSPEIGLEWRPADGYLLYYTYSQGFKAGTGLMVPGNTDIAGPEKIKNHEIGFKGSFADNRLQFNLSAYTYRLTGSQYQRSMPGPIAGFITVLENAAATEATGVEATLQSVPYRSDNVKIQLNGTLVYQHSRFDEYNTIDPADPRLFNTTLPASALVRNLKGNPTRSAPDWSGTAQVAMELRNIGLPGDGTLTWSGDLNYQSRNYLTEFKKEIESAPPRAIIGSQLTYRNHSGLSVAAWVKNLTNKDFITSLTYINAAGGVRLASYFPPRTYGLTVGLDF